MHKYLKSLCLKGDRQKRQLLGDTGLGFFDRPFWDDTFFLDPPTKPFSYQRTPRQLFGRFRKPQKPKPVEEAPPQYPPFDPFGNTEYIETGPSNPNNALPLSIGNPHANFRFRPFVKK